MLVAPSKQAKANTFFIVTAIVIAIGIIVIIAGSIGHDITWEKIKSILNLNDEEKTDTAKEGTTELTEASKTTANDGQQQTQPDASQQALQPSAGSGVVQCNAPSGFFSIVYARRKQWVDSRTLAKGEPDASADVVGIFKYTGNCPTDIYLEAGIINSPSNLLFSALPREFRIDATGKPSNCDGNTHYNGAVYHVEPNADIKFRFQPKNYGIQGTYPLNIGAYWGGSRTGCLGFGGSTLTELHSKASFSNSYSISDLTDSYEAVT